MPLSKLVFKPGINRDQTNYSSEGGWYESDKIRFRSGFPEKIGGWTVKTFEAYNGAARSLFNYTTSNGSELVTIGTNTKVYVNYGTTLTDITPLRVTYNSGTSPSTNNTIETTNTSTTVTVNLTGHGASTNDFVTISGSTSVGGIPDTDINAEHQITVINSNKFTFTVPTAATSTVASGGGTSIVMAFQISVGNNNVTAGYGFGAGAWSRGTWGSGSVTPVYLPARLIFQDNYYDNLIWNIQDSNIYYWAYTGAYNTRGVLLSSVAGAVAVPQQVGKVMFAPSGHLLALRCTSYDAGAAAPDYLGAYDPLLIRWANVDADIGPEPENWQPTVTNTAGFLRLQSGSEIITGIRTRQETLIFTDKSVTSLQFLGTQEVFGLQELASNISILGPNVAIEANNIVYWMGNDKFYFYSGRVDTLPCTLRQYVFTDINLNQQQIFFAGTNNQFNEIVWFYCSSTANQIDRYVIYNYSENIWYYGQLERTAWLDSYIYNNPVATQNGWVYYHEDGHDDGQPLGAPSVPIASYIQSADIDIEDGDKYMLVRRLIPDINFTSSDQIDSSGNTLTPEATVTVGVRNFPGAARVTTNVEGQNTYQDIITSSATINQYTNQVFIRARGRQMSFKISSDGLGVQWQLGMPRVDARPDGLRS